MIWRIFRRRVSALSLTARITIIVCCSMLIPAGVVGVSEYLIARNEYIETQEQILLERLESARHQADLVVRTCRSTSQGILSDHELLGWLDVFPEDPQAAAQFHHDFLQPIRRIADSNSLIHGIRLYVRNPRVPEFPPELRRLDQMREQSWYAGSLPARQSWKFNYPDAVSGGEEKYAYLLSDLSGADGKPLGALEISASMRVLFPALYQADDVFWAGFADASGTVSYNKELTGEVWGKMIGTVVFSAMGAADVPTTKIITVGPHTVLTASVPVSELSGRLIAARILDSGLREMKTGQFFLMSMVVLFNFVCVLLVRWIMKRTLGRLAALTAIIQEVQRGDLAVTVPPMGPDEIGRFAKNLKEMIGRLQMLMDRSVERELLVKNTEIRALQNQINSHFIYNVLESIKMMAEIEGEFAISDAVTSLGKLLRYSMKWVSPVVTLSEELEYIQNYLSLLNLRYDYVITLNLEVPEKLLNEKVPKMSLQPIVENAVYHGIDGLEADAVIRILGREWDGYYEIEITDSGRGMSEEELETLRKKVYGLTKSETDMQERHGIGLRNVQDRIRLNCGAQYGLRFAAKQGCFTKVIIKLPLTYGGKEDGTAVNR